MSTVFDHLPVTALHFLGEESILSGEGNAVCVYDVSTTLRIGKLELHRDMCIHGIRSARDKYNEESLLILVFGIRHFAVCRWFSSRLLICEGHMSTTWDRILDMTVLGDTLYLITAHNRVIVGDWRRVLSGREWSAISCEEQCILYAAHFLIPTSEDAPIFVAAGTVFNEVLLWRVDHDSTRVAKVLHRLKEHKGVIFHLDFDHSTNRLCSVSDDRTIALWHGEPSPNGQLGWTRFVCLCRFLAHDARVWAAFLTPWGVVSIGEDCNVNVWCLKEEESPPWSKLHSFAAHRGRGIWSLAVSENGVLASGGNDGAIFIHPLSSPTTSICVPASSYQVLEAKDFPRNVFYGADGTLYVVTDQAQLLCREGSNTSLRLAISLDSEFRSYNVVCVSEDRCSIVLGSLSGSVRMLELGVGVRERWRVQMGGKVMSVIFLDNGMVLAGSTDGQVVLISRDGNIERRFLLPPARRYWWMTAAALHDSWLVIGDREGAVHLFSMSGPETPLHSLRGHGKHGVTTVCWAGDIVSSAGKNGVLLQFRVVSNKLETVCEYKTPADMSWIDRIIIDRSGLLLCGFHSSYFLLVQLCSERTLLKMECGGGHRTWDVHLPTSSRDPLRLAYVSKGEIIERKDGDLGGICLRATASTYLKDPWHGREINCCLAERCREGIQIFTGSEDTAVSSAFISSLESPWSPTVHRFASHISSVRCMVTCCMSDNDWLFTGGARGMLIGWRRWPDGGLMPVGKHFVSGLPRCRDLDTADLRIMAVSALKQDIEEDGERYERILIAAGCSDGQVRIISFTSRFRILSCARVTPGCLLTLLLSPSDTASTSTILTGATDSCIRLHSVTSDGLLEPRLKVEIKESGAVNCLSKLESKVLIGGDSGVVSLCDLSDASRSSAGVAHAASVTAVAWCGAHTGLSLGGDQRLKVWREEEGRITAIKCVLLTVADPHDVAVVDGEVAVVVGNGVQVLKNMWT